VSDLQLVAANFKIVISLIRKSQKIQGFIQKNTRTQITVVLCVFAGVFLLLGVHPQKGRAWFWSLQTQIPDPGGDAKRIRIDIDTCDSFSYF
jgi:hypothetical protein